MSNQPPTSSALSAIPVRQIAEGVCVAGQLTPQAMAGAAAAGFRSVVNNRPDFEHGPNQPTNADIEAAALASGMLYRFLPVAGGHQTPEEAAAMAILLQELPKPLLMFCRTGNRCNSLYRLATAL